MCILDEAPRPVVRDLLDERRNPSPQVTLFLAAKGVAAPVASTLAVFGQAAYFWLRAFVGNSKEGGVDPPPYVPGALARYFALVSASSFPDGRREETARVVAGSNTGPRRLGIFAFELYKLA